MLLVDDDGWMRSLLGELLVDEGYRVLQSGNGLEVVHLAKRHRPNVILLDLALPWKDGFSILEDLRACDTTASIPVIVVSGELDASARVQLLQAQQPSERVMEKPVDVERLLSQVQRVASTSPA